MFQQSNEFGNIIDSKISHTPNTFLSAKKTWTPPEPEKSIESSNGISYTVELPKRAGLSWGSDLSFRWIYVLDIEPMGEASQTGMIQKGDYIIGVGNTSTLAQDFDFVLFTLAKQEDAKFNYTFFRGTKEQLTGSKVPKPSEITVTVKVLQDGKPDVILKCPGGTNLRQLLIDNGINVYRSLTRWTNCSGKQLCGACTVEILDGVKSCTRRCSVEEAVLGEIAESYRMSCITSLYGDITVRIQGAVETGAGISADSRADKIG